MNERRGARAGPTRRDVLAASLAAIAPLAACTRDAGSAHEGGWVGADAARGHLLRSGWPATKSGRPPEVALTRRAGAIVVGAGIAGLGAARALGRAGVDDCQVLELEDSAGGNSRGHVMAGMRCPLGAHYLPVPGPAASEVIELLDELGVRRSVAGRPVYDERVLCHSPQERLFIDRGWREGLLPPVEALPAAQRATTLADYRAFSAAVAAASDEGAFEIPTARSRWTDSLAALDRVTFAGWLDAHGLRAPALRWYLDYCCRDDYGAGSADVSAWAGLHYFASRHGFRLQDDARSADGEAGVLTWPEGNAWLAQRLAAPLGERLQRGRVVLAVEEGRHEVSVDAWNAATSQRERWLAPRVVLATPLFVAARLLAAPPPA
ncbi:MAG TPA: FAD-dependent oxidoreductase, partial [Caldimonas sp.]|nr:FAD-dependent oxidoreductase [Caldimonas sp.]